MIQELTYERVGYCCRVGFLARQPKQQLKV